MTVYMHKAGLTFEEWRMMTVIQRKPITNADRIRAMSDEGLAKWLAPLTAIDDCDECKKDWLDWLKREVKNERTD